MPVNILGRIRNSVAFRSGQVAKLALICLPKRKRWDGKPSSNHLFVAMCGKRHLKMLEESMYSMALFCSSYPNLRIFSDGSLSECYIKSQLSWWPGELEVPTIEIHEQWAKDSGFDGLLKYSQKSGFGKKLLVVSGEAQRNVYCWFDTDILFLSDIQNLFNKPINQNFSINASEDWCYGYDTTLTKGNLSWLMQLKPVNTGFMQVNRPFYAEHALEQHVNEALDSCNGFTEQTILAKVVHKSGEVLWELNDIPIYNSDIFTLGPTFINTSMKCRHYVTPIRHLFWRDALALRLGVRSRFANE